MVGGRNTTERGPGSKKKVPTVQKECHHFLLPTLLYGPRLTEQVNFPHNHNVSLRARKDLPIDNRAGK